MSIYPSLLANMNKNNYFSVVGVNFHKSGEVSRAVTYWQMSIELSTSDLIYPDTNVLLINK